jgi:hypothetical protein
MFKKKKDIKDNEIIFYPVDEAAGIYVSPPEAASKAVPEWFKSVPKFTDGEKEFIHYGDRMNLTVKACLPLIDAFTSGYVLRTPCDIQVRWNDGDRYPTFTWPQKNTQISPPIYMRSIDHDKETPWKNVEGYEPLMFNFMPSWCIKTPKGYSSLFIHPINRTDLPFYTIGGVLDTDGWGEAGMHPFLLKKGWSGIIPEGTPYMQIIPFKRQDWVSVVDKTMTKEYSIAITKRDNKFKDFYKKTHWKIKSYR